jgi:preprotein translocase subunit SecF
METLKNLTLVQWIGIMVGLNSLLMGATPQLTFYSGR